MSKINTKNPFEKGVTYEMFLSNVKGKVTVDSLLKDAKCSDEQKVWLKEELKKFKNK